jgi:hypothetical protein
MMRLDVAAGLFTLVVFLLAVFAFSNWNDPKNDLHGKK